VLFDPFLLHTSPRKGCLTLPYLNWIPHPQQMVV
jgi:hypothetical protein